MSGYVARARYVLSGGHNERIFRADIVPAELDGTTQERPVVVVVAGQTGAGRPPRPNSSTSYSAVGAVRSISTSTPTNRQGIHQRDLLGEKYTQLLGRLPRRILHRVSKCG
jgi:hypothetical protein